jgi:hypothetical protein
VPDPTQTFVNPEAALAAADRLTQIGSEFATQWSGIKSRIDGLHADTPWGNDEVGQQFVTNYLPGGEDAGAQGVLTGLTNLGQTLSQVGPSITEAVNSTVETDEATGQSMQPS